jgi:phosphoserine phosphatase
LTSTKTKLVAFDVEGVILDVRSNIFFNKGGIFLYSLSRRSGAKGFLLFLFHAFLYRIGLASLGKVTEKVVANMKGLNESVLLDVYRSMRLRPGVVETFQALKKNGLKTALLSNGIPNLAMQKLGERLGADFFRGLDLEAKDSILTGRVLGSQYIGESKVRSIAEFCEMEGITPHETAAVGDDATNAGLFRWSGIRIGVNPDRRLVPLSDTVLYSRKLTAILPAILMDEQYVQETPAVWRKDWIRNVIHFSGILTVWLAMEIGEINTVLAILCLSSFYLISELFRLNDLRFPVFAKVTNSVARLSELQSLVVTPIYFAVGIMASFLLYPRPISYAAIAVFTVGDSVANLAGKRFGTFNLPYNKEKTLEGSLAGFAAALVSASIFLSYPLALLCAVVALFVESLPLRIDDNLSVPIASGACVLAAVTFL